jgi:serine/threonine protein phosphatase PrpC
LDAATCCSQLVAQSIAQGGTDNLTAVIVDCAAAGVAELAAPSARGADL